ncbi:MAG: helical backbone metal receptor [Balneolaceae bacterium]
MQYKRIISLVPSLTELIIDFGLQEQLVGRTRFCIHPKVKLKRIPIIGGTKNPSIDKILSLAPDLIIANKEENRKEDILQLSKYVEVVTTEIDTVEEALKWINVLGNKLEVEERSSALVTEISNLNPSSNSYQKIRTAYFIWKDPWMSVGNDTYIHDVMKSFGLGNIFEDETRYPSINLEKISSLSPELILLSSEPYPFKETHIQEIKNICPKSTIQLIDGEWFSWYGSRMVPAFKELRNWRESLS